MSFKRFCASSGCRNDATDGSIYCAAHKTQFDNEFNNSKHQQTKRLNTQLKYDHRRGTAHQRGYSARWTKYAKLFLINHPNCITCGEPAQVVDHILPGFAFPRLFWTPSNHQPLCVRCNKLKSIEDNKKYK